MHTQHGLQRQKVGVEGVIALWSQGSVVEMRSYFFLVARFESEIHKVYSRYKVDMDQFPTLMRVDKALHHIDQFAAAHPDKQPDANLNA